MYRSAAYDPAMSRSTCSMPRLPETERLHGPGTLDRLGEGGADPGVPRARAGSLLGAPEVPPRPDEEAGDAEQDRHQTHHPTSSAAATVSTAVISAIIHSGRAQRTDQPSCSMSRDVRVSRSPLPADSTVPTGSATRRSTKSSRSSASTVSPNTNERNLAHLVSSVWATIASAMTPTSTSTCPGRRRSARPRRCRRAAGVRPDRPGRPAVQPQHIAMARGCFRSSVRR